MKTRCLLLLSVVILPSLRAADVNVYALTKAQFLSQTSTAAPVLNVTNAFTFAAIIDPATATSVTSATLRLPDLTVRPFGPVPGVGPLGVAQQFNTEALLEAAFPTGGYLFTMNTVNDGVRTPTLNLPVSAYPNAPFIVNFAAAQAIDWTQAFAVQWQPFVGGGSSDYIQMTIRRTDGSQVFRTPDFGQTGALTGAATSATIPANTLVPGTTYRASVVFGDVQTPIDLTSYQPLSLNFVPGVRAFAKTTDFPIAAPGTKPALEIRKGAAADTYDLSWSADLGRTYSIVWTEDFVTWTPLTSVLADEATETVTDAPGVGVLARFYKVQ